MRHFIRDEIARTADLLADMARDPALLVRIGQVVEVCVAALGRGGKILFAGNGGSAADAQHLAAELVGRLVFDRPGLPALSLTTDTSILTAVGNDYGYDLVFARQLDAIGTTGDVFIGLSTSGRSLNVVRALERARHRGIITVGLVGAGGGDMAPLCDHCLVIPSRDTPKIQEGHIVVGHIVCTLIERAMFPDRAEAHDRASPTPGRAPV